MAKFRVRARTVDMLGRQQIAGIPTAISELFKNAHDAYARNVEVDYFRDDGLFVLRDDGLGMTKEDFEQRWLTLGTESKVSDAAGLRPPPKDPDQLERPVLGEKGIGRLAIAIIGPQVLVLTRAKRDGKPSGKTVGAYINWRLFELPGLDLEDIVIPIREFKGGNLPDSESVREMVAEAIAALNNVAAHAGPERLEEIRKQMNAFHANPAEYASYLREPSLTGNGCGTHFYILPADPIIQDDIDRGEEAKATRFEKHLIGFTNTMTPGHEHPPIITRFRDYVDEGTPIERIGERVFFTPDEFEEVDHHVIGRFDEYGQFQGEIGIYQAKPETYVLNWSEANGKPSECGPFSLSFAYMQGAARDSLVPIEEHTRLARKLNRHGGLYIYRNGIRVQPYGDSDYDFLDIERRRTLSASYYFYSYRRMFGVIELDGIKNKSLTEKAGREGFRENKAYRQFRSILMNFFLQTAGDFFREEGRYADRHSEKKEELNRNEEIRRNQAKQVTAKRLIFRQSLTKFFDVVDEKRVNAQAEKAVIEVKRKADQILRSDRSPTYKATALMDVERAGRDVLRDLRKELTVTKPRGVGLSRALNNEWEAYQSEKEWLEKSVLSSAELEIETLVSDAAERGEIPLDHVARLDAALRESGEESVRTIRRLRSDVEGVLTDISKRVRETTRESFRTVNHTVDDVMAELETLKRSASGPSGLSKIRAGLEEKLVIVFEEELGRLERLRDQLNTVSIFWHEDGYDSAELTEALEEELENCVNVVTQAWNWRRLAWRSTRLATNSKKRLGHCAMVLGG
ncbi:MAG: ATP-binding protein [Candidatus Tectomicrobia bacterium]|nr:ATP-binding protein [Candidatus Tectomicrobia bacterium]